MKSSNKNFILCTEGERSPVYAIAILNENGLDVLSYYYRSLLRFEIFNLHGIFLSSVNYKQLFLYFFSENNF